MSASSKQMKLIFRFEAGDMPAVFQVLSCFKNYKDFRNAIWSLQCWIYLVSSCQKDSREEGKAGSHTKCNVSAATTADCEDLATAWHETKGVSFSSTRQIKSFPLSVKMQMGGQWLLETMVHEKAISSIQARSCTNSPDFLSKLPEHVLEATERVREGRRGSLCFHPVRSALHRKAQLNWYTSAKNWSQVGTR